ncbi:hypothetical protein C2845_PM16G00110 [Panicum miliaceum]|uniref:Uncharacterized protein n=1 Tax=Panicum miliaceum TaxID=4540 RepID=A0A3L6PTN9_PANMI|nr:hypothetical protein C2845_PM16G00110 [Panicum miliaceum]
MLEGDEIVVLANADWSFISTGHLKVYSDRVARIVGGWTFFRRGMASIPEMSARSWWNAVDGPTSCK